MGERLTAAEAKRVMSAAEAAMNEAGFVGRVGRRGRVATWSGPNVAAAKYRAAALARLPLEPIACWDCYEAGQLDRCDHPKDFRTWPPCEPRPDRPSLTGAR